MNSFHKKPPIIQTANKVCAAVLSGDSDRLLEVSTIRSNRDGTLPDGGNADLAGAALPVLVTKRINYYYYYYYLVTKGLRLRAETAGERGAGRDRAGHRCIGAAGWQRI